MRPAASKSSDYQTAPQLSPAYCRFLALFLKKLAAQEFKDKNFIVIDLGSGFGELAMAMLQTFPGQPVVAVEISPYRRNAIAGSKKADELRVVSAIHDLGPDSSSALIAANEFFDALPVRVFLKDNCLKELYVDMQTKTCIFKPAKKENVPPAVLDWMEAIPPGTIFEFETALPEIAATLSKFQEAVLLVVDYGFKIHEIERFQQGTIVGFSKNRFVNNVLEKIANGECLDVTHQVNFTFLGEELKKSGWRELFFGSLARFVIENSCLLEEIPSAQEKKQLLKLILGHRFGDSFKAAVYIKKMTENDDN